jgi:hypothetical protein
VRGATAATATATGLMKVSSASFLFLLFVLFESVVLLLVFALPFPFLVFCSFLFELFMIDPFPVSWLLLEVIILKTILNI